MTERIDDLTPELRDLLAADAPIPPVPADVRDRLRTRLDYSRAETSQWRGAAEMDPPLRPRRRWGRRVAAVAMIAAAAAMILAYTLSGHYRRQQQQVERLEPVMERHTIERSPEETTPQPAGVVRAKAKALRFQFIDHSTSKAKLDLHSFVARDKRASRYGIKMSQDAWSTGSNNMSEVFLQARAGKGPCTWKSGVGALTTRNRCKLNGREMLEGYLRDLYRRKPALKPGAQHQILFEKITSSRGTFWRTHYAFRNARVDGSDVATASVVRHPTTNFPEVRVVFTPMGRTKFAQLTKHNVGSRLAIVVNGDVVASPVISDAITGGRTTISLGGTRAEAQAQATKLVNTLRGTTP